MLIQLWLTLVFSLSPTLQPPSTFAGGGVPSIGSIPIPAAPAEALARIDAPEAAPATTAAPFPVRVDGQLMPYSVFGLYVLPGDVVELEAGDTAETAGYAVRAGSGGLQSDRANHWRWHAPAGVGLYPLTVTREVAGTTVTLNVFVLHPRSLVSGGYIRGFRVGRYPEQQGGHEHHYAPPRGFVEVTRENADTYVSPHFQLKQFVCKAPGGYPSYLVLEPRLIHKLEEILAELNRRGVQARTLQVMSGYRTPAYNRGLGNVQFSRHQFGDASDIFVDGDGNGRMDDLNRDGRVSTSDAKYLYDMIEGMSDRPAFRELVGGMGFYPATSSHGPFVHVDTRGFRARWAG